jgi:hypothetical protein
MADVLYFADLQPVTGAIPDNRILAMESEPPSATKGFKPTMLQTKNYVNDGQTGGKTVQGGTGSGEHLTLQSTSHGTKGNVQIADGDKLITLDAAYDTKITADVDFITKKYFDDNLPVPVEKIFTITSDGQTAFTLDVAPASDAGFKLYLNGQLAERGIDYTRSGTAVTWINSGSIGPLETIDFFVALYNDGSVGGAGVTSFNTRTGAVTSQSGDYSVAQITGAAASGANSDITSLSGLTTPLSIAQGGTNSGTTLVNGKVMASSGGAIVASAVDVSSLGSKAIISFGTNSVSATITTRYLFPFIADSAAPTSILNMVVPYAGTISKMHVYHNVTAGNGNNIVYTLVKNATPTALTVTIPSTTQTASDLVNSVSVNAGDTLALEVTKALSIGSSPVDIYVTMEIA